MLAETMTDVRSDSSRRTAVVRPAQKIARGVAETGRGGGVRRPVVGRSGCV